MNSILIFLIFGIVGPLFSGAPLWAEQVEDPLPALTCKIIFTAKNAILLNPKTISCSGVIIGKNEIATNAHCEEEFQKKVKKSGYTNIQRTAKCGDKLFRLPNNFPVAMSPNYSQKKEANDIAILKTNESLTESPPIVSQSRMETLGFSMGECRFLAHNKNSAVDVQIENLNYRLAFGEDDIEGSPAYMLEHDNEVAKSGNSGGPLFCRHGPDSPWVLIGLEKHVDWGKTSFEDIHNSFDWIQENVPSLNLSSAPAIYQKTGKFTYTDNCKLTKCLEGIQPNISQLSEDMRLIFKYIGSSTTRAVNLANKANEALEANKTYPQNYFEVNQNYFELEIALQTLERLLRECQSLKDQMFGLLE